MDLWVIFLTGLTTGGLSCLAVQGGLLASAIANQKGKELRESAGQERLAFTSFNLNDWLPVTLFLAAKLVAYTVLGFFLGWLGSVITLSLGLRITFQALAALFMLATALNLLNVHPIFRYVVIQPPRFVRRLVKSSAKADYFFSPAVLGFLTVLIPCGVTQAMEILAINSGSPFTGALIMMVFVLGTSPIFGLVGIATAKLSEAWRTKFLRTAAILLIAMSVYSLNGALQAADAPVSWARLKLAFDAGQPAGSHEFAPDAGNGPMSTDTVQRVKINVENRGYRPDRISVRAGIPVELTVSTDETYSCAAAFTFREFGIYEVLDPTDSEVFRFTPEETGIYIFACSMGMYTGVMEVY
ncbi:MAG: sulfite exporter TauE/SafE family protein [Patescibacteria group bacterium]